MRSNDDIIQRIAGLKRDLIDLKTRQFTGSNQIVMRSYETQNAYDWFSTSVIINPQAVSNAFIVKVKAADPTIDLIADVIVKAATSSSGPYKQMKELIDDGLSATPSPSFGILNDFVDATGSAELSKTYAVSLRKSTAGGGTGSVYAKVQVIANTEVIIETSTLWG